MGGVGPAVGVPKEGPCPTPQTLPSFLSEGVPFVLGCGPLRKVFLSLAYLIREESSHMILKSTNWMYILHGIKRTAKKTCMVFTNNNIVSNNSAVLKYSQ